MIGLGDTSKYDGWWSADDEVYVLRFLATDAPIANPHQALAFVRAAGKALQYGPDFFAVGIVLNPVSGPLELGKSSGWWVDVVFTAGGGIGVKARILASCKSGDFCVGDGMIERMGKNKKLRGLFPQLKLSDATWVYVTSPQSAINFWLIQPPLWQPDLSGGSEDEYNKGGPTQAYMDSRGVWLGKADDRQKELQPTVVPPIDPPGPSEPPSEPAAEKLAREQMCKVMGGHWDGDRCLAEPPPTPSKSGINIEAKAFLLVASLGALLWWATKDTP